MAIFSRGKRGGPGGQPWRCLCLGFSQMIRTWPNRRMILHFMHIFFTEERTFTVGLPFSRPNLAVHRPRNSPAAVKNFSI